MNKMTVGEMKKILDNYSDNCIIEDYTTNDDDYDNVERDNFNMCIEIRKEYLVKDKSFEEECKNCINKNNKNYNYCEYQCKKNSNYRYYHYHVENCNTMRNDKYKGYKIITDCEDDEFNYLNCIAKSKDDAMKFFNCDGKNMYVIKGKPIQIIEYDENDNGTCFNL